MESMAGATQLEGQAVAVKSAVANRLRLVQRQAHFFPQTFSVQIAARLSKAFGCALFGT